MKKKHLLIVASSFSILLSCHSGTSKNSSNNETSADSSMHTSEKKANLLDKINQVPITPLPIGIKNLDSISELPHVGVEVNDLPVRYEVDIQNKFGINNLLDYGSASSDFGGSFTSLDSVSIYVSKRLPPKDNYNFLLCKIIQHVDVSSFVGWVLYVVKDDRVVESLLIAQGLSLQETFRYVLFSINDDYSINLNLYETSYYQSPPSKAYLTAKQIYIFSSEDGGFIIDKEEDGLYDDPYDTEDLVH